LEPLDVIADIGHRDAPARLTARTYARSIPNSRASRRIEGEATGAATRLGISAGAASSAEAAGAALEWARQSLRLPVQLRAAAPPVSVTMRCPTASLSPALTCTFATTPAAVEGMLAMAFSFSSSISVDPCNGSPSFTKT